MKKKLFTIALAIACVTTLTVGCGEKEKADTTKQSTKKEQTAKEKKESEVENGKIFFANQDGTQIHETADFNSKVIDTVSLNDELMTISDETNGFRKVTINGKQGFVATAYLAKEKLTVTAKVETPVAPVTPGTVVPDSPQAPSETTTAKPSTTTTTKPSTSTTTTKPSTPAPAPTPAPKPAPTQPVVNNCPYTLLVYTTYQGHYGFFYSLQEPNQTKQIDMMNELYSANIVVDPTTNAATYPTEHKLQVGFYTDKQQVIFFYVTK